MNGNGYSWPEALLTLTIVMVIFGTLLPLASQVTSQLQYKRAAMRAAETAHQAAILFDAYGMVEGQRHIEGIDYDWLVNGSSVCVSYNAIEKVERKCIDS